MRILFYDSITPYLYTAATLTQTAIGGTEATVIRIAHGLAPMHEVFVAEHCCDKNSECIEQSVNYISFATADELAKTFDVVILLRDSRSLVAIAQRYVNAKLFFWMHNTPVKSFIRMKSILLKYHYTVIAVSQYHADLIKKRLQGRWFHQLKNWFSPKPAVNVKFIYNPIADDLQPDATVVQNNKLLFLSSPQKGLAETLKLFERIRQVYPEYFLYIGNPGHRYLQLDLPPNAELLGPLPHHQIIQHLREAFCVFYPQHLKTETFGLVYAEANAVGTPVLAHDHGAAAEVLSDSHQLLDGSDLQQILAKLTLWREQRPKLIGKNEFRLKKIIEQWHECLSAKE